MKLKKKHIGGVFDVEGADGSWAYQLVALTKDEALFYVIDTDRFEIESRKYHDWRPFQGRMEFSKKSIAEAWKTARRTPYQ